MSDRYGDYRVIWQHSRGGVLRVLVEHVHTGVRELRVLVV